MLGVEGFSIEILEDRKFFIESFSIVFLHVRIQDRASFFDKVTTFLTIDKLSNMLFGFCSLDEREPDWIWFSVDVRDNLDTFPIFESIVERNNLTIYLCDTHRIPEIRVDRIGKIDWRGSFRKGDDIPFWREDENLIRKDIYFHFLHEFSTLDIGFDNTLNRFYPITIFRVF